MRNIRIKISPLYLLAFFVIFIAATHYYSVYELGKQNITGLNVTYDYKQSALVIDSVNPNSSVASVPKGTLLLSLTDNKETIQLTENITMWGQANKNYEDVKNYFDEHKSVYSILQDKIIIANIGRSDQFKIHPSKPIDLTYLPIEFWAIRFANIMALLISLSVWIYRPRKAESFYMVAAGIGYYFFGLFYSIIEGNELTISTASLITNFRLQILSLNFFTLSFLFLLLQYPTKIFGIKTRIFFFLAIFLVTLSNLNFLPSIPFHAYFFQVVVLYLISIGITFYQWRNNAGNPINKAATIALQFSLLAPSFLIILLYFLPEIYNEPPIINQFISHILLSVIFIGWAVSILKFKLFEVERWWFKSWLFIISTLLIICVDFVLLYLFNFSKELTTAWTIIIVGFLYFPARQFLLSRFSEFNEPPLKESILSYVEKTKESKDLYHYDQKWLELLTGTFHPMECEKKTINIITEKIENNGLHLIIRSLFENNYYILSGKQRGNRLFNQRDLKYCQILFETVESIVQSSLDKQKIRLLERKRIMHDLHDNLGAMLLTMTYSSESTSDKEKAKNALSLLRDTVYYSTNKHNIYTVDLISRCRSELEERLLNKKTNHNWTVKIPDSHILSSETSLAISYIIREAFTNAIKHAEPEYINIYISLQCESIFICIKNNNKILKEWKPGFGVNSIKRRCKSIMAEPRWHSSNGIVTFELKIPV